MCSPWEYRLCEVHLTKCLVDSGHTHISCFASWLMGWQRPLKEDNRFLSLCCKSRVIKDHAKMYSIPECLTSGRGFRTETWGRGSFSCITACHLLQKPRGWAMSIVSCTLSTENQARPRASAPNSVSTPYGEWPANITLFSSSKQVKVSCQHHLAPKPCGRGAPRKGQFKSRH